MTDDSKYKPFFQKFRIDILLYVAFEITPIEIVHEEAFKNLFITLKG